MATAPMPHLAEICAGDVVFLEVEIREAQDVAQPRFQLSVGAFLNVYDPDGNIVLTESAMSTPEPGLYRYNYQTGLTDPVGLYTVEVIAYHGTRAYRSDRWAAWRLSA